MIQFFVAGTPKAMSVGKGVRAPNRGGGFRPWRRDVYWQSTDDVALTALHDRLDLTGARNWGWRLRRGLVEITAGDMAIIAAAMATGAAPPCRRAA